MIGGRWTFCFFSSYYTVLLEDISNFFFFLLFWYLKLIRPISYLQTTTAKLTMKLINVKSMLFASILLVIASLSVGIIHRSVTTSKITRHRVAKKMRSMHSVLKSTKQPNSSVGKGKGGEGSSSTKMPSKSTIAPQMSKGGTSTQRIRLMKETKNSTKVPKKLKGKSSKAQNVSFQMINDFQRLHVIRF